MIVAIPVFVCNAVSGLGEIAGYRSRGSSIAKVMPLRTLARSRWYRDNFLRQTLGVTSLVAQL
jgi:hypothetical protein